MRLTAICITAITLVNVMGLAARASVMISAQSVLHAPQVIDPYTFDRTIDGSGLWIGYVSGVTDFGGYISAAPTHNRSNSPANYSASATLVPQIVDFDLGQPFVLEHFAFWNYPFSTGAVSMLNVFTAGDAAFTAPLLVGTFAPVDDGDSGTNTLQNFDLTDSQGRYVRVTVTGQVSSNGFGFSEIAFGGRAVPEPSSSLLAFGVATQTCRIRRRSAVES